MKHLALFEGFISNLFKKKRVYSSYWKRDEMKQLEEIGFYSETLTMTLSTYSNILDNGESYYYTPKYCNIIKNIIVRKYEGKSIGPEIDSEEYEVTVNIDDKNKITKDIIKFSDVLEFVKIYIPEIDNDINKYNL